MVDPKSELNDFLCNPGRFAVLVLGARGIGKSRLINEVSEEVHKQPPTYFNCAGLEGDTMALSELFGHKKDAFTGATKDKTGLFHEAKQSRVLFFDEVHNLDKRVQEKLMTALQTVQHKGQPGWYRFRPVGSSEEEHARFQPVFASNKSIEELEHLLLPDFFDRINQLSLPLPSLRDQRLTPSEVFLSVWSHMRFPQALPSDQEFNLWLDELPLHGNYRDLEKIAIILQQALIVQYKDPFSYAIQRFELFHRSRSSSNPPTIFNFRRGVKLTTLEYEYREALQKWALSADGYGSRKKAEEGLGYAALPQLLKVKKD